MFVCLFEYCFIKYTAYERKLIEILTLSVNFCEYKMLTDKIKALFNVLNANKILDTILIINEIIDMKI